jgi:ubiquitin-protein ligase
MQSSITLRASEYPIRKPRIQAVPKILEPNPLSVSGQVFHELTEQYVES